MLNPPYGREIDVWIAKLVEEYDAGSVSEALALIPARVDTTVPAPRPVPVLLRMGPAHVRRCSRIRLPFRAAVVYLGHTGAVRRGVRTSRQHLVRLETAP